MNNFSRRDGSGEWRPLGDDHAIPADTPAGMAEFHEFGNMRLP